MRAYRHGDKGQALILSYLVVAVLLVYTGSLLTTAMTEKNIAERNRLTTETLYLAEGATENALKAFASGIANFQIGTGPSTFSATTTYATFGGTVVNTTITALETDDKTTVDSLGRYVYERLYEAVSTAAHPQNNAISVTVHQIFSRRLIPTFQHIVFYDDDLEILPGPDMTLSGRIHSNEDIYLDSNGALTVDTTYLRSAGNIYNARKDGSGSGGGDVSVRVTKSGAPQYEDMDGLDSSDPNWATEATSRWNGTVMSAVHGVTALTAPSVGTTAPDGYYAGQADVVITNDTIVKNGVTLTEGVDYPAGTITSSPSNFYNNREGKYVKMTTVDIGKLSGLSGTCGGGACPNNLPANGLLYATRTDAIGAQQPGIKLINGSEIPRAGGFTVVSNVPAYIQGDYNTTNEKPTSVIADAVNLLSKDWDDARSTLGVNSRPAATTTYNTAFVAGVNTTTAGQYNGGLENYPRLHENWTGDTLNIKGSFVQLWESAVATGAWVYGEPQYTAPNRNWTYNSAFNDPAHLPPFTPMAVETRRVAWWKD